MSDHLHQWRAVPPREHAAVGDIDVRRDDQRSALVHRTEDVFERMPRRTVGTSGGGAAYANRGIDISKVGASFEQHKQVNAFGGVSLKSRKRRDATLFGRIDERSSGVHAPVVSDGNQIDTLCLLYTSPSPRDGLLS